MSKFIEQTSLPANAAPMSLEQTGKAIELRAQEVIANASLDNGASRREYQLKRRVVNFMKIYDPL